MSKELMIQARELIMDKRYDEARALLQQIDHELARQWLEKLDEIAPVESQSAPETKPESGELLKEQMQTARNLIMAKEYVQARAILEQIDHPTAQKWLAKIDELEQEDSAAPVESQPVPETAPAEPAELSREEQEQRLLDAQELILSSKFEAAQIVLEPVTLPEAILWRNKTQMNKFREFQSLWLDLYYYDAPEHDDPAGWKCAECGRTRDDALACPQQGHKPCPLVIKEHVLAEPNRLALVLGSIYMGQTGSIKTMLKDANAEMLAHWRMHLEQQLNATWDQDVRRPVLETAIMLLHQLEQTRLLQG